MCCTGMAPRQEQHTLRGNINLQEIFLNRTDDRHGRKDLLSGFHVGVQLSYLCRRFCCSVARHECTTTVQQEKKAEAKHDFCFFRSLCCS